MYYCIECGIVHSQDKKPGVIHCSYCQKVTVHKEVPKDNLKFITEKDANSKLRAVHNLFVKGEMKNIDFLTK